MDTGRIPGSIRIKWRRLRARADMLRLQKQTKNKKEREVQGLQLPTEKGRQLAREEVHLLTGKRHTCPQSALLKAPPKNSLVAESQNKNS